MTRERVAPDADGDLRELAVAAKRLVCELDRRRRSSNESAPAIEVSRDKGRSLVDGMPLQARTDAGGWRELLAGRRVHAGDTLYLLTSLGWPQL